MQTTKQIMVQSKAGPGYRAFCHPPTSMCRWRVLEAVTTEDREVISFKHKKHQNLNVGSEEPKRRNLQMVHN